ncbi:hypothetical protein I3760_06G085100 [Carya illinoinensis]|nr:hypothetical protein I3760_06G085100 [Carya illinoinensis]
MEKQNEVVVFGTWASAYCTRVEIALALKGIPYEYKEEDLTNKSESLLYYNPVHKKVPVLVHNGKSIAESLVILEYIDDCWKHAPKLLPEDPYLRAKLRFWANFYDQKFMASATQIIMSRRIFLQELPCFDGKNLGFLDIVVGTIACNYEAFHEAVAVIFSPETNPTFWSWVTALKNHPLMKEMLPPHDKLVAVMRQKYFQSA